MNAIEIKGLEKRYDGFQLGSFDLTLPSGCIMGLVGEHDNKAHYERNWPGRW